MLQEQTADSLELWRTDLPIDNIVDEFGIWRDNMYKWLMSCFIAVACLFGIYLLSTALPEKEELADKGTAFIVPDREVDTAASEQIYQSMCISCHGDQLQGKIGPELAHIGSSMTKEQLFKTISEGKRGMPAFEKRLSEDELITITTWLASHQ